MNNLQGMGTKIAQLRRSSGMTQEELGKLLSVSAQAVSKWENSDSLPDLPLIVKIAETFNCSTDYLLGREGGLISLIPQIRETLHKMELTDRIAFLEHMITLTEGPPSTLPVSSSGNPSLVHIHLGPAGLGLWAKDRLACIATPIFLKESVELLRTAAAFPLNLLSDDVRLVLLILLREIDDLKPEYALDEKTLRTYLPDSIHLDQVLTECIELGFVDRVRGGYRLNFRADLTVRLLAMVHQIINQQGTMNVTVGNV
ncbi:helix-turn-helix domain-containing protein [Paenibacillus polysaccharolyticus]|uniref:helix-turn-helix domain-containing protein n=1 Tax=Paenibacillus polysaccharolyticus TaxID=582692 RepID=UPI0012B7FBAC|nr:MULTISPECIES: helix-turn-helix transcriptional regulator [Paenibacillus]MCP1136991.1 helix-turn-helix domain-containing protein [Paenibacillus polysaccharolyticus]